MSEKLKSGTIVQDVRFTASEVCSIIRVCKGGGISRLRCGDFLDLTFDSVDTSLAANDLPQVVSGGGFPLDSSDAPTMTVLTDDQKEAMEELRLEEMQLDDPVGYETLLIDGFVKRESGYNEEA